MKNIRSYTFGATLLLLASGTALAEPNDGDFRSKQSGPWTSNSTWERYSAKSALTGGPGWLDATTFPSGGQLATVREGHTVQTSDALRNIGTLIIEDSATVPGRMEIASTTAWAFQWLIVDTALQMEHALANPGEIVFTDVGTAGPTPKLLLTANVAIEGNVRSQAAVRGGAIETTGGAVLTIGPSGVLEASQGKLTLTATFEMEGTVRANGPYLLWVSGAPRPGSSGKWEVTHDSAILRFNHTGPFTIDNSAASMLVQAGTLDIDQTFTFHGGLKKTGGAIDVAAGKTLTVSGRYLGN